MVTFHVINLLVLFVYGNGDSVHEDTRTQLPTEERLDRCATDKADTVLGGRSDERRNTTSSPPNVILLLADDLGYGDLSFSGHPTSR